MSVKKDNVSDSRGNGSFSKLNVFEKILTMLNNYGYKKVISSLIILMAIVLTAIIFANQKVIIERIVREQRIEQQAEHANRINFRITQVNPRVDAILYKLLIETGADRAFVIEMHNGTDNPTGLPFVFGAMTYEKLSNDSVESIMFQYEKINLSTMPLSYYLIKNKRFAGEVDSLKNIDIRLSRRMVLNDTNFLIVYGLRTLNTEIGWLGITYSHDKPSDIYSVESKMIDASESLSILLDLTSNIK